MSSPPTETRTEQPPLVSLVLQSKKALQHGEQLCSKANSLTNASAQCAVDVLALDAKVKWASEAVIEQLKLAASVAKSIELRRSQLERRIREWDTIRSQHTTALDNILEALGAQLVPPEFHQTSSDSSLFGSYDSIDKPNGICDPRLSPSATLRDHQISRKTRQNVDRTRWKTLRDFVDEAAIEDVLDSVESERTRLDDIMTTTYHYPETLSNAETSIRESLPISGAYPPINPILSIQEHTTIDMARHLESLTAHYEQMASALHDSETGEVFSEEDLRDMNRDTEELPVIMSELEESVKAVETAHEKLLTAKAAAEEKLDASSSILDDLDELGEIMSDMLEKQQEVEGDCEDVLEGLQQRLQVIQELHHQYVLYQSSFNKLLVEIARRRQYREAAEKIVEGMVGQLRAMAEGKHSPSANSTVQYSLVRLIEERQVRDDFNAEHGAHIPADLCLCIENPPTRWDVVPLPGDVRETLPEIDSDLLAQVRVGYVCMYLLAI
ncbi:autophagy protein Apg17-domain-containing protein [Pisolithus croceorrhizus]|nr:autophagy protein Apg17-domain-containing protein [Pisolithus croceorrhizus]